MLTVASFMAAFKALLLLQLWSAQVHLAAASCELPFPPDKLTYSPEANVLPAHKKLMSQACVWTGSAKCTNSACNNRCIANTYPAHFLDPFISGACTRNDHWYALCPQLALMVETVKNGGYFNSSVPDPPEITGLRCPTAQTIASLEQKMKQVARELRKVRNGQANDVLPIKKLGASILPALYDRQIAFLEKPEALNEYFEKQCNTEAIDFSQYPYTQDKGSFTVWDDTWSLGPPDGPILACINLNYLWGFIWRGHLTDIRLEQAGNISKPYCDSSPFGESPEATCYDTRNGFGWAADSRCLPYFVLPYFARKGPALQAFDAVKQLRRSCEAITSKAACQAAEVPEAMKQLQQAAQWTKLVDPDARNLQLLPVCEGAEPLQFNASKLKKDTMQHETFTTRRLSIWRRIYISEAIDNVIVAVCALMATVAISAAIERLVRLRKGRAMTCSALRRQLAYQNIFVPAAQRMWRMRFCRAPKGSDAGHHGNAARAAANLPPSGRSLIILLIALVAALAWLACEVAFIVLLLPARVDLHFPYALEHVIVSADYKHNLGIPAADGCRSLSWAVSGGLAVNQALTVQRCKTQHYLAGPPTLKRDSLPQPPMAPFLQTFRSSNAGLVVLYSQLSREVQPTQTDWYTHVYRPTLRGVTDNSTSQGGGLSEQSGVMLQADFDFIQFEPFIRDILNRTSSVCQLHGDSACTCQQKGATYDGGLDYAGTGCVKWQLQCKGAITQHVQDEVHALVMGALDLSTDVRVARRQDKSGFVSSLVIPDDHDTSSPGQLHDLVESMRGDSNVVATAVTSRINLLSAMIVAVLATALYQLMQIRDECVIKLALHCKHHHTERKMGNDERNATASELPMCSLPPTPGALSTAGDLRLMPEV